MDEPEIVVMDGPPEDPGDVVLDEPTLTYQQHPAFRGREGWVLTYPEPDGNGVEDYRIGGDLASVNWALDQAREHLRWAWSAEGRP
jgi:hypothetical protein